MKLLALCTFAFLAFGVYAQSESEVAPLPVDPSEGDEVNPEDPIEEDDGGPEDPVDPEGDDEPAEEDDPACEEQLSAFQQCQKANSGQMMGEAMGEDWESLMDEWKSTALEACEESNPGCQPAEVDPEDKQDKIGNMKEAMSCVHEKMMSECDRCPDLTKFDIGSAGIVKMMKALTMGCSSWGDRMYVQKVAKHLDCSGVENKKEVQKYMMCLGRQMKSQKMKMVSSKIKMAYEKHQECLQQGPQDLSKCQNAVKAARKGVCGCVRSAVQRQDQILAAVGSCFLEKEGKGVCMARKMVPYMLMKQKRIMVGVCRNSKLSDFKRSLRHGGGHHGPHMPRPHGHYKGGPSGHGGPHGHGKPSHKGSWGSNKSGPRPAMPPKPRSGPKISQDEPVNPMVLNLKKKAEQIKGNGGKKGKGGGGKKGKKGGNKGKKGGNKGKKGGKKGNKGDKKPKKGEDSKKGGKGKGKKGD